MLEEANKGQDVTIEVYYIRCMSNYMIDNYLFPLYYMII